MKTLEIQLKRQSDELRVLDNKILDFSKRGDAEEETSDEEVDEASEDKEKITRALVNLEQKLKEELCGDDVALCRSASPSQQSIPKRVQRRI